LLNSWSSLVFLLASTIEVGSFLITSRAKLGPDNIAIGILGPNRLDIISLKNLPVLASNPLVAQAILEIAGFMCGIIVFITSVKAELGIVNKRSVA
jgi:hypothetical protein